MGIILRNNKTITPSIVIEKSDEWKPDADMVWAKSVCENDVQEGFQCKVLQMINNYYPYTDIVVPNNGAVKTSDGGYYTENVTHTWDDTNARQSEVGDYKLRWLIYYDNDIDNAFLNILDNAMYTCLSNKKFDNLTFRDKQCLQYFDLINNAKFLGSSLSDCFSGCFLLQSVPLFDISSITDMSSMFLNCYSLQSIPSFDISSITDISNAFNGCAVLKSIPLLDNGNLINLSNTFNGCSTLQFIPFSDTNKTTRLSNAFAGCFEIKALNLNLINITSGWMQGQIMNRCINLEFLTLTNVKANIDISYSTKYSRETLLGIINNLVDLTGQTAQILKMGAVNLAKLTNEDKQIATNKNWTLQ